VGFVCALGRAEQRYSWAETQTFVVENFATFSEDLAELATRAFEQHWIDAEQRTGKRGGAFCMGVPLVKESRILINFDGSLDQISTVAHELGHAFHNECAFQAGKTMLQTQTPMTLAETASIMCETIVTQAVLARARDPQEELAILENMLTGEAQVIVDIYSRYLFEQEVFVRRAQSELTADELCDIMRRAQEATYGEGLDDRYLQPYMWTWKPHYYSAQLSFYNFPYASTPSISSAALISSTTTGRCWLPPAKHPPQNWLRASASTCVRASSGTPAWR
jgi:oligoendopeptidase F